MPEGKPKPVVLTIEEFMIMLGEYMAMTEILNVEDRTLILPGDDSMIELTFYPKKFQVLYV